MDPESDLGDLRVEKHHITACLFINDIAAAILQEALDIIQVRILIDRHCLIRFAVNRIDPVYELVIGGIPVHPLQTVLRPCQ